MRFSDRVKESSSTSGTGDLTLNGPSSNFTPFSFVFAIGELFQYSAVDATNNTWEVGIGTLISSTILRRLQVLTSSSFGQLVSFAPVSKVIFNTISGYQVSRTQTLGEVIAATTTGYMP